MKTNHDALNWALAKLNPSPGKYNFVFHDVLAIMTGLNNTTINSMYSKQQELINFDWTIFTQKITDYQIGKPLAYITNYTNFYNLRLYINEDVFIPRLETESLVTEIITLIKLNWADKPCLVYEMGTGSGAIGLSIAAALPHVQVVASDISHSALQVARKNKALSRLNNIKFITGDKWKPFLKLGQKCDVLVFNPPYLTKNDPNISAQVFDYEPHQALFAEHDGLEFYQKYLTNYLKICKTRCIMGFEIGFQQKIPIEEFIKTQPNQFDHYYFLRDLNGLWRMFFLAMGFKTTDSTDNFKRN